MMKRLMFGLALLVAACGQVDPGERAVFVVWGEMTPKCFSEGLYWYNPISTDMWEIDVKEQKYEVKADAGSRDLQDVHTTIVVNYTVDGTNCHTLLKTVGTDFVNRIMAPAVQEVVKANTPRFDAEKIIQQRAELKKFILTELRGRLDDYGIKITEIALTNIGFGEAFEKAIERKSVQQQEVLTAKLRKDQAEQEALATIEKAKGDGVSRAVIAKGEADAILVKAQAQAEANNLINKSLTTDLIQYRAIVEWDGKLPTFMGGGVVPFLNVTPGGK